MNKRTEIRGSIASWVYRTSQVVLGVSLIAGDVVSATASASPAASARIDTLKAARNANMALAAERTVESSLWDASSAGSPDQGGSWAEDVNSCREVAWSEPRDPGGIELYLLWYYLQLQEQES
jgi:hypothetical protein